MKVEAVSFDGDGTLWDFDAVMRHALRVVLEEIRGRWPGPDSDALTVAEMIAIRDAAAQHQGDWSRLEEIRQQAFAATLERVDGADRRLAGELNALYLRHRFEDIALFPDVLGCLDAVAGTYRLGLVSNGNSYPERCGLDGRFSFTVFAQDHGVAKPDPHLFEVAATQAGCAPSSLVHVGDGEADVLGAKRAGCRAVLINRQPDRPDYAEQADDVIADLRDLTDVLTALIET